MHGLKQTKCSKIIDGVFSYTFHLLTTHFHSFRPTLQLELDRCTKKRDKNQNIIHNNNKNNNSGARVLMDWKRCVP